MALLICSTSKVISGKLSSCSNITPFTFQSISIINSSKREQTQLLRLRQTLRLSNVHTLIGTPTDQSIDASRLNQGAIFYIPELDRPIFAGADEEGRIGTKAD